MLLFSGHGEFETGLFLLTPDVMCTWVWKWNETWKKKKTYRLHVCYYKLLYIELTISFLIGWKRSVNYRNQRLWHHLAADYTIIMSRTLKVTGNHVMCDSGAWLIRVVMSRLQALCWLPSVKKLKHDFLFFVHCIMKQLLDSVFVISRIVEISVNVISQSRKTPTSTLIFLEPHPPVV